MFDFKLTAKRRKKVSRPVITPSRVSADARPPTCCKSERRIETK
jgi:hypothetical protein